MARERRETQNTTIAVDATVTTATTQAAGGDATTTTKAAGGEASTTAKTAGGQAAETTTKAKGGDATTTAKAKDVTTSSAVVGGATACLLTTLFSL